MGSEGQDFIKENKWIPLVGWTSMEKRLCHLYRSSDPTRKSAPLA